MWCSSIGLGAHACSPRILQVLIPSPTTTPTTLLLTAFQACTHLENTTNRSIVNEHRLNQLEEKRTSLMHEPGFERNYFNLDQDIGDHLMSTVSCLLRSLLQPSPGTPLDLQGAMGQLQESVSLARWGLFELDAMVEYAGLHVQGDVFLWGTNHVESRPIVAVVLKVLQDALVDEASQWHGEYSDGGLGCMVFDCHAAR